MPGRRRAPLPPLVGCNFFLFAAVAQVVYVPLLLSRPDRTVLLLGIAGNPAIVLLYLIIHIPGGEGSSAIKAPYRSRMEAPREARRINVQAVSERRRVRQDVFSMGLPIIGGSNDMTDIICQRLFDQRIEGVKLEKPEEVVGWLGAIQAQDYLQALWAIGLRLESPTVAKIEQAILDGKIVRTWPMRGTLHFVPPEDAKWMLKLSASRMLAKDGRRLKQLGLNEEMMEHCKELFYDALRGNKRLSRQDMMRVVERAGISTENQRGYHILWYVAQSGLICLGPMHDKQQTFVLLDEWVPDSRDLSREESLTELARRYFASHGPATVYDFAWWAGLTVTEARAGLEAARPELSSDAIDGKEYWMKSDAPGHVAYDESRVDLLPGFDEYLIGYKDRSAVLGQEHAPRVVPGRNGIFRPVIVVGGRVVGTWRRKLKKNSIDLTLNPFTRLGDSQQRAIEAANSYCNFVGLPLSSMEIEQGN